MSYYKFLTQAVSEVQVVSRIWVLHGKLVPDLLTPNLYQRPGFLPPPRKLCLCQSLFVCLCVSKITQKVMEGSF